MLTGSHNIMPYLMNSNAQQIARMKNMQRRIKELSTNKLESFRSNIARATAKQSPSKIEGQDESLKGVSFREYLRSIRMNG
jgi:hypothetical protein